MLVGMQPPVQASPLHQACCMHHQHSTAQHSTAQLSSAQLRIRHVVCCTIQAWHSTAQRSAASHLLGTMHADPRHMNTDVALLAATGSEEGPEVHGAGRQCLCSSSGGGHRQAAHPCHTAAEGPLPLPVGNVQGPLRGKPLRLLLADVLLGMYKAHSEVCSCASCLLTCCGECTRHTHGHAVVT